MKTHRAPRIEWEKRGFKKTTQSYIRLFIVYQELKMAIHLSSLSLFIRFFHHNKTYSSSTPLGPSSAINYLTQSIRLLRSQSCISMQAFPRSQKPREPRKSPPILEISCFLSHPHSLLYQCNPTNSMFQHWQHFKAWGTAFSRLGCCRFWSRWVLFAKFYSFNS